MKLQRTGDFNIEMNLQWDKYYNVDSSYL